MCCAPAFRVEVYVALMVALALYNNLYGIDAYTFDIHVDPPLHGAGTDGLVVDGRRALLAARAAAQPPEGCCRRR